VECCVVVATYKELWNSDASWYSQLESSQWLMHVSSMLSTVANVVNDFVDAGKSVVLRGYYFVYAIDQGACLFRAVL